MPFDSNDNRARRHIASGSRQPADSNGGTAGRVIDLAGGHDHDRCIVALHVPPGFGPGQAHHAEKLRVLPGGAHYDFWCEDCPSKVMLVANPPACLAGAYIVTHSKTCPWLRQKLAGAR